MVYAQNGLIFAKNKTKNNNAITKNVHFIQFETNVFLQNGIGLIGKRYRFTRSCHPQPKQITASSRSL